MKRVVRYIGSSSVVGASPIVADDEVGTDEFGAPETSTEDEGFDSMSGGDLGDQLDSLADGVEDIQDQLDDVEEDDVSIEIDNNIEGSLIAECDSCKGIFISAMRQSDQNVDHISGVCPICNKETDQVLKWVIQKLEPVI